jgi:hypothetical protein
MILLHPTTPYTVYETFIPRVACLAYTNQQHTKSAVKEAAQEFLKKQRSSTSINSATLIKILLNSMDDPKNLKFKMGCIGLMAELEKDEWMQWILKPANYKLVFAKAVSIGTENDIPNQKHMGVVLGNLWRANASLFWDTWDAMHPSARKACTSMLGKEILQGRPRSVVDGSKQDLTRQSKIAVPKPKSGLPQPKPKVIPGVDHGKVDDAEVDSPATLKVYLVD